MIEDDELMDESQVDNVLRNLKQRNNATQNELSNCKVNFFLLFLYLTLYTNKYQIKAHY